MTKTGYGQKYLKAKGGLSKEKFWKAANPKERVLKKAY
jgi:hypothetical protein